MRNPVHQGGQQAGRVGVPGVGVHEVGALQGGGDLDIHTDGLQRPVRGLQPRWYSVGDRVRPRLAEAVDGDVRAVG